MVGSQSPNGQFGLKLTIAPLASSVAWNGVADAAAVFTAKENTAQPVMNSDASVLRLRVMARVWRARGTAARVLTPEVGWGLPQSLISQMTEPLVTTAPTSALSDVMVPALCALSGCSIFIASRTTIIWPASTVSP